MFGEELTEQQRQSSLTQSILILAAGGGSVAVDRVQAKNSVNHIFPTPTPPATNPGIRMPWMVTKAFDFMKKLINMQIPTPRRVQDSMGNNYIIWMKSGSGGGGNTVKRTEPNQQDTLRQVESKSTGNVLGDGTMWEDIKITQPLYEGTKIPKSFELVSDGKKFWLHPNGTKHMVEYITRDATTHGMPINSQTLLSSFQNSVKNAVKEGIKYEEIMNIDNWELIFSKPRGDGLLPVVKHAVYMP